MLKKPLNRLMLSLLILSQFSGCKTFFPNKYEDYNPYKDESAEQLFDNAEIALKKQEYSTAIKRLEAMDSMYPFHDKAEQAQLDLIYAYYKKEDFASAAAAAERFIHMYPRSTRVDYAYYMKGLSNFRQLRGALTQFLPMDLAWRDPGTQTQSYSDFATLVQKYPHSKYTPNAKQRMIYLRNLFAAREMHIANYYFYRQMYVAAAERGNYVVKTYPQSSSTRPALGVMYHSYLQLGQTDAAAEVLSIYKASYHCMPKRPKNILHW